VLQTPMTELPFFQMSAPSLQTSDTTSLPTQNSTNTENLHTYINTGLSGTRTHNPSVPAADESSCGSPRSRGLNIVKIIGNTKTILTLSNVYMNQTLLITTISTRNGTATCPKWGTRAVEVSA
jgi:hypothetical protein